MTQIKVSNLSHAYGDKLVLENVSIDINSGELLSLVGASGCGKSTLLRLCAGILTPSKGSVVIENNTSPRISMVFQDSNLLPWMNVLANVNLPLKLKNIKSNNAMEWLERVGLKDSAKLYPDELSGGMKMRVALARAMVSDPDLLLLDEPFGALDEITRQEMGDELLRFRNISPCTTIFVTHSVAEAIYLSDRVALMQANPGLIKDVFNIDSPDKKDKTWRIEEDYLKQVALTSQSLQAAIEKE
jgi:NitT/TauT family transport system ATP-binding protein